MRLSGVTLSSFYRACFAASSSCFSAKSLAALGLVSAHSSHYEFSRRASSSCFLVTVQSLQPSDGAVELHSLPSVALARRASRSAIRSSLNLMIILSRARFFSDASSAVYFSLLDLARDSTYCSYCFYDMSMFSRFSARSFSTFPTRSFIY